MSADRDPFDGLRLDERFVRGARFVEPAAADRRPAGDAKSGAPCQVSAAPRGLGGFFHRLVTPPKPVPRRRRTARLVATVALAVGMVSLAVVLLRQNATRTQPGAVPATVVAGPTVEVTATATEASSGTTPGFGVSTGADPGVGASGGMAGAVPTEQRQTAPGVVVPAAVLARLDRGVCLTWTAVSGATATGVNVVDCSGPHRAEVTGLVDLAERFPAWPGRGALDGVVEQSCPEALADHMVADPRGLLAQPSGAYPAQAEWTGGSRALACLVVDQVSGTWSGSVRESDQVA